MNYELKLRAHFFECSGAVIIATEKLTLSLIIEPILFY